MNSNYNAFYNNVADFGNTWAVPPPVAGPNDLFQTGTRKYILRLENDSPFKGAGSDGKDLGATILYRRGKSGTLYGEPGYDSLTAEPLWPFPNEDQIKTTMSAWDGLNDPKRGFAADGNGLYGGPITLTSYIWEYLGNPFPGVDEIYAGVSNQDWDEDLAELALKNFPNPFNPSTEIAFHLPKGSAQSVQLDLYNAQGRLMERLMDRTLGPGTHRTKWQAGNFPSGIYVLKLKTGNRFITRKVYLQK